MADNTTMNPGTGGDLIASDELSTINGGAAAGGLKVQRVYSYYSADSKLCFFVNRSYGYYRY